LNVYGIEIWKISHHYYNLYNFLLCNFPEPAPKARKIKHKKIQWNCLTTKHPNYCKTPKPTVSFYMSTLHTPVNQHTKKPIALQRPITSSDEIDNNPFLTPQSYMSECGISNQPINSNINPLIAQGIKTSLRQWPWLVALFVVKITVVFQCSGSILTQKHIITGMF